MRGVAVLIPDKRGSGQSGGDWMTAGFDVLAEDAAASLEALRSLESVDESRCGVVGLSQGGWVAPDAARLCDGAYAASLVTAFTTPGEQILHDVLMSFRADGVPESTIAEARDVLLLLGEYIRTGEGWAAYDEAATALRAAAPAIADAFPPSPDLPMIRFFSLIFDFDFEAAVQAYDGPKCLLLGAVDHLDNVPIDVTLANAGAFLAAHPRADLQIQVYPHMGHALGEERVKWVSPKMLDDLSSWIDWRTEAQQ